MTTDTPKRFTQSTHAYSDRSRQSLTFSNAATAERSRSKNSALGKLACFLVLLVFLVFAGVTALSRGQHSAHFRSRGPFSNQKLRHFGQTASNELQNCTARSTSAVCKWAKQHSRTNRKRPADWKPKVGWPDDMEMAQSVRHTSDRALTAVDNSTSASSTKESLQSVLQTLWPVQRQPDLPTVQRSSMPQCAALYNQPCIAVVGMQHWSSLSNCDGCVAGACSQRKLH